MGIDEPPIQAGVSYIRYGDTDVWDDLASYGLNACLRARATSNNPPYAASGPSPTNHASGVSVDTDLSWTGGDPDAGDTVTYDVYLDTTGATTLVSAGQSGTTYDPGTLNYSAQYYWKIVATDNHGANTTGPLWDFTTGSVPLIGYRYTVPFVCGTAMDEKEGVKPANYATTISIHNPQDIFAYVQWKAVRVYPSNYVSGFKSVPTISADGGITIRCLQICKRVGMGWPTSSYCTGFVVIYSDEELDVTGVYTSEEAGGTGLGLSIDVQQFWYNAWYYNGVQE